MTQDKNKDTKAHNHESQEEHLPEIRVVRSVKRPTRSKPQSNPMMMRVFRVGLNPVLMVASLFLIGFIIFGANFGDERVAEVNLSTFVQNLRDNNYSILDIKDNNTAEAKPKFILRSVEETTEELEKKEGTEYVNAEGFKEVSLEDFYKLVEPKGLFENVFNFGGNNEEGVINEIIVGTKYIIGVQAVDDAKHYIVKNTGKEEFESLLNSKNVNVDNLGIKYSDLTSASKEVSFDKLKTANVQEEIAIVYDLGDETLVRLDEEKLTNDIVNWNFIVTGGLATYLESQGVDLDSGNIEFDYLSVPSVNWGDVLSLVMIAIAIIFGYFLFRSIQGGGSGLMKFGQSKARLFFGMKPDVTFKDVAGVDEAKEELAEIVEFLKNPNKFRKLGARIPKGVLMFGPPGTGKTLLARAIAGEAGVPFFHTSGAEFEEMLVGAGASRVRDLFDKAKKASPSLIFIDEIDAVARKRGTTIQSSTTEQTLNQILTEMDGFEKNTNVIILAATNRPDVLDPAILRPGRFDRRVVIDLPDLEGRKQILAIHAANKPLAADVNLEKIAKRTVGFSGADLENTLNEAAIIAAKEDRKEIEAKDIEEAASKTTMGPAKKNRVRSEKELKLTAVHEAGHAVVSKFAKDADPVHRVSIISRGMAGGVTEFLPQNDDNIITRTKLYSRIVVALGGRAAEDVVLNDISTGASSDIEQATNIARRMVQKFGMSEKLGLIKYGDSNELQYLGYGYGEQRDYSDDTAKIIDEEVRALVGKAYKDAVSTLTKHRDKLDQLTKMLLDKEIVEGDEFDQMFEDAPNKDNGPKIAK